jgi:hypothetical protein
VAELVDIRRLDRDGQFKSLGGWDHLSQYAPRAGIRDSR